MRLLHRLGLQDGVLRMEVLALEGGPLLGPHAEDQPDGLFHLPDAHRGPRRELPAVLPVLRLEPAGADAEGEAAAADLVDAGRHLRQVCGIAIVHGRDERRETDALGHRGEAGQDRPALHERLVGRADIADLDEVVHHREPGEAVVLRPLGLGFHRLEYLRRDRSRTARTDCGCRTSCPFLPLMRLRFSCHPSCGVSPALTEARGL